jgi:NADPH:quinone reductase-like Zn-dependent oxidoreductase
MREVNGGNGVDVVFDSVGKATLRDSFRACRKHGLVVNYGNVSGSVTDLDLIELGEAGSLFLTRPRLADHMVSREMAQRRADHVFAALLNGSIQVYIEGYYSLDNVEKAHARIENREQVGKPILRI